MLTGALVENVFCGVGGVACSGGRSVGFFNQGATVTWTVSSVPGGVVPVVIRYGAAGGGRADVIVNGVLQQVVVFGTTSTWANWSSVSISVPLRAGANTVTLRNNAAPYVNLDYLEATT